MREYRKEIIIALISIAGAILAVWFFFFSIDEKKVTIQGDLYTVIASNPDALVCINRPSLLTKIILSDKNKQDLFTSRIPEIFLSILDKAKGNSFYLISFHTQGVVMYTKATLEQADEITYNILHSYFNSYNPQRIFVDGIEYTFYAIPGNRFFVTYYSNGIWAASYSKKLLENVAIQQKTGQSSLSEGILSQRKLLDRNAPLNIIVPAENLNVYVQTNDSTQITLGNGWVYADIFTSENNLCFFTGIPYNKSLDSIYPLLADTLTLRLKTFYPQHNFFFQLNNDNERIYYTACLAPQDSINK
jgi:hypothetical protein